MAARALRVPVALVVATALVGVNVALGVLVAEARARAVALALVPVLAVAVGALIASNRVILVYAALALNLLAPLPLVEPLPLDGGIQVYPSDVLVALAAGSWVAAWLMSRGRDRPGRLNTRVLGWPLLVFATALLIALVRGHELYGTSIFGAPLRIVLYAGIAFAMTDLDPRRTYRGLVVLFYGGAVWQMLVALYSIATGTSATDQVFLSTGGERVLAGSTAMFMAGTLLLALLNVEIDRNAGRTGLHLLMAGVAGFALAYTYQRTTFAVVALLVPVSLLAFRRVRSRTAAFLPLVAPLVVLAVILVPVVDPHFFPTLADRITASPGTDATATYRREAYAAVWAQARDSPLIGVGFGRPASFVLHDVRYVVGQDPHNQFLYLLAGGGVLLFGSFILLLLTYVWESWRRFTSSSGVQRRLVFWAVALWFVFVVNSLTGIILTQPHLLLTFWILMLLPMVGAPQGRGDDPPA